jgi:hypothetical protein
MVRAEAGAAAKDRQNRYGHNETNGWKIEENDLNSLQIYHLLMANGHSQFNVICRTLSPL